MKIWSTKSVRKCCCKVNRGWDIISEEQNVARRLITTNWTLHFIDFVVSFYFPVQNAEKLKGVDFGKHSCKSNLSAWWLSRYQKMWCLGFTWKLVKNAESQIHFRLTESVSSETLPYWKLKKSVTYYTTESTYDYWISLIWLGNFLFYSIYNIPIK